MAFWNIKKDEAIAFLEGLIGGNTNELYAKELMVEHAIDLIARTIAKSELQVYKNKKGNIEKVIDDTYYRLNVRPNPNEDGASFWKKVISWLLRNGEALVIIENQNLYMASDWNVDESFYFDKAFKNIELMDSAGNLFKLEKSYRASDVIYLNMGDHKSVALINSYYSEFSKAIGSSFASYRRSNAKKYILSQPTNTGLIVDKDGNQITFDSIVKKITENLMSEEDSVQPLPQNYSLTELNLKEQSSDDLLKNIKDFGDKVATAFDIPLDVFYGTQTEKSEGTDDFITFACLYPLQVLQDGLNAKLIEKKDFLKGERIIFNKHTIKHFDIVNVASSLDKLFAMGYSFNMIQDILNEPRINEPWADLHHVTKNYYDVESEKGGE